MKLMTLACGALSLFVCLPAMAEEAPAKAEAPASAEKTSKSVLTLGALEFWDNGKVGLTIAADGTMTANTKNQDGVLEKKVMGQFSTCGKFTSKDGQKAISLNAEGIITGPDGQVIPGKIGDNGDYTRDGKTLVIHEDGSISVDGKKNDGDDKIVGVTPETRRLAVFATVMLITTVGADEGADGSAESPAVKSPAVPVAPAPPIAPAVPAPAQK